MATVRRRDTFGAVAAKSADRPGRGCDSGAGWRWKMNLSMSFDDHGLDAFLARMPGEMHRAFNSAMEDATTLVLRDISVYPTQRSGSGYRRTHTLQRSWSRRIEWTGDTIVGIVGSNSNMAPYNRAVQDRDLQARVHQGRWQTIQSVIESDEREVNRMFQDRVDALMRSAPGR